MKVLKSILIGLAVLVGLWALFCGKYAVSYWFYEQAVNCADAGKDPTPDLANAITWINDDENALASLQGRLEGQVGRLMDAGNFKGAASLMNAAIPIEEHIWGKGNALCKKMYITLIICDINAGNYDHAGLALQESIADNTEEAKNHPNDPMYKPEDPIYKAKRVLLTGELMEEKGLKDRAVKLYRMGLEAAEMSQKIDRSDTGKRDALWILARAQADLGTLLKNETQNAFAASVADSVDCDRYLAAARQTAAAAAQVQVNDPAAQYQLQDFMDNFNNMMGTNYKTDKERVDKLLGTT